MKVAFSYLHFAFVNMQNGNPGRSNNELCQNEMKIPAIYFLNAYYCEVFSLVTYCMPTQQTNLGSGNVCFWFPEHS